MAFNSRVGRAVLELSIDGGAFVRGAGDAKATMRDLARGIAQTQREINQQTFQFSGRQQLAEANRLAEAVQRVGGAQRLTAAEQSKVNAQLTAAIDKYRALGQQAPASLIAVEQQTRRVQQATDKMAAGMAAMGVIGRKAFDNAKASDAMIAGMSAAGKATSGFAGAAAVGAAATVGMTGATQLLTRALGTYLSVGAVLGAIRSTLHYAEALEKASVAAGGTAREIQRLENIAVGGNTTLDAMIGALATAQDKASEAIVDSSSIAAAAFRELGIEVQAWMELSPDKQVIAIADGLKRIASNERQIKLAKDILGRGAVEIMGALRAETGKLADSVKTLSDEQVKQLADLESGWDRLSLAIRRTVSSVALQSINNMLGRGLFVGDRPPEAARTEPTELLVANQRMAQWRVPDMVAQLKEAEGALKGLSDATLKQLTAAKQLSTTTDEDLLRVLRRVGIDGDKARNVLKLFEDQLGKTGKTTKSTADEWQQMLDRFNGSQDRTQSANLGRAIGSGQIELARLTDEAQQAIRKALEDGAAAWQRWGGIVPLEVDRALAAVKKLTGRSTLTIINDLQPNLAGPEPSIDDVGAQLEEFERPGKLREESERNHVKAMRELDMQRAEFAIRQAERAGAKRVDILRMESMLEQRRRDMQLAEADEAFAHDVAQLHKTSSTYEAEYAKREQEHQDHVAKITQQWEQGEIERREMIRRESTFWATELGKRIKGELRGILFESTGRLFSTLFTGVDEEAGRRAKEARDHYERLKNTGRASAEEITRAFREMREAEAAAQSRFADRFKSIWDGIKRHLFNIFDQILEAFINNLLKGMVNALLKTGLGQRIGKWLGIPGIGGSGGGGLIDNAAGAAIGKLLGIGGGIATTTFSTTAGGTLAASMIAPSVAMTAVPPAIVSGGASAAVYGAAAGSTAAAAGGGAAAGTAAGAGAGAAAGGGGGAAAGGGGAAAAGGAGIGLATGLATAGAFAAPLVASWVLNAIFPGGNGARVFREIAARHGFTVRQAPPAVAERERLEREREQNPEKRDERRRQIAADMPFGQSRPLSTEALAWADKAITLTQAFVKAGRSAEEGLEALNRLFDAEKKGARAVNQVRAEIEATLQGRGTPGAFTPRTQQPDAPMPSGQVGAREPAHTRWFRPIEDRKGLDTFHTGGVVGDGRAKETVGDLKANEVIAKLLKGEGVLNKTATAAIGGKPVIDLLNAGNHQAIADALKAGEVNIGEVIAAVIKGVGKQGVLGGAIGPRPARAIAPFGPRFQLPQPKPLSTAALDAALNLPVHNSSTDAAMAMLQRMNVGGRDKAAAAVAPRHTTIKFEIKALDGADVEKVVREKVAPKLRFMIASDQDGMGTVVKRKALE